jgi:hypothetical protein
MAGTYGAPRNETRVINTFRAHLHRQPYGTLSYDLAFLCLFFAVMPFAYVLQVLTGFPEAALVGYFFLVAALLTKGINWQITQEGFFRHSLSALVFLVIAHNAISGLAALLSGNVAIASRVLCLFVLPVGVFILASKYNDNQQWKLVKVVAITAIMVALEMLHENVYSWWLEESSPLQLMNRDYVFSRTGRTLTQIYHPGYRTTGPLEHVHVSTFFMGIGILAWLAIYLEYGKKLSLLWMSVCWTTLIVHGVRTPLIASCIAVALLIFLAYKRQPRHEQGRWKIALGVLIIVGASVVVLDPFGTVQKFYLPVLLQNDWDTRSTIPMNPEIILDDSMGKVVKLFERRIETELVSNELFERRIETELVSNEYFSALFGYGIGAALMGAEWLDDHVFVLQLISQYGLLGSIVFIGMFFAAARSFWITFNREKNGDSILLLFAFTLMVLLGLSMAHGSVIQRKAIFPILLWAFAIIYGFSRRGIK